MITTIKLPIALALILTAGTLQTSASKNSVVGPEALTIELARCRVEILISSESSPGLQVFHRDGSEVPIETIPLSITNGAIRIRDQEDRVSLSDLIFSFTLQRGQRFQVYGTDLDLVMTDPDFPANGIENKGDSDSSEKGAGACQAPQVLNLVGGTAHIIGGRCTTIFSTEVELNLERTSEALEIKATGGRFRILGHQGKITLDAEHFGGVITDHRGDLEMVIAEGQVSMFGGTGKIRCQSDNSGLYITNHHGTLFATGAVSAFTVDHSRLDKITLGGTRTIGRFSNGEGHIRATLEGGRLSIDGWAGRIDLQSSQGTAIDIEALDGDFAFSAVDGTGEVTDITGHTRGSLTESEFRFSRLKSIEITADTSQTTLEDVPRLTNLNIIGGHFEYRSSRIEGKPKIHLSAGATADFDIPEPCIVRCTGPGAKISGNIRISGCEFRRQGQPWGKRHHQEKNPIHLEIEMLESSEVFVSGN